MKKPDYSKPDFYSRQAKEKGYVARSVFKLEEMDRKFKILKKGMRVLELGSAPGSWMQYASEKVGESGRVIGIDRDLPSRNVRGNEVFIQADVFSVDGAELKKRFGIFDLVLSDLAPDTSGQKGTDAMRSVALAERAEGLAEFLLKPGGDFLVKVFQGPGFEGFNQGLRLKFRSVKSFKPKSSRPNSKEIYIFCKRFRA